MLLLTDEFRINEVVLQLQCMVDLVREGARAAKLRTQGRPLGFALRTSSAWATMPHIAATVYYIVEGRQLKEERPKADVTSREVLPLPS